MAKEWRRHDNSGDIFGSATATLTLTNVSLSDAANYSVTVSNAAGSVTSSVVTLTVLAPPAITAQPVSLTNMVGATATFSVTVTGSPPMSFQWYFNGINPLVGGTNSTLLLTSIQTNQAGAYAVLVTNTYGSVWTSNAVLTVNLLPTSVPIITSFNPIFGTAGTRVTITGLNFSLVAASNIVHFGRFRRWYCCQRNESGGDGAGRGDVCADHGDGQRFDGLCQQSIPADFSEWRHAEFFLSERADEPDRGQRPGTGGHCRSGWRWQAGCGCGQCL